MLGNSKTEIAANAMSQSIPSSRSCLAHYP